MTLTELRYLVALSKHRVLLMGEGHCFRNQVLDACPGLPQAIRANRAQGAAIAVAGTCKV
jgi:hypothetical protein